MIKIYDWYDYYTIDRINQIDMIDIPKLDKHWMVTQFFFLDDLGPAFLWARAAIPKLYSCRTANIALRFAALFLWFKAADVPVDLCHRVEFDVANDRYRRPIASHAAPFFLVTHFPTRRDHRFLHAVTIGGLPWKGAESPRDDPKSQVRDHQVGSLSGARRDGIPGIFGDGMGIGSSANAQVPDLASTRRTWWTNWFRTAGLCFKAVMFCEEWVTCTYHGHTWKGLNFCGSQNWDMSKLGVQLSQLPYFEWWNRQQTLSGEEWLGEASGYVAGPGSSWWPLPPQTCWLLQLVVPCCTPIPWYSHNIHPQIPYDSIIFWKNGQFFSIFLERPSSSATHRTWRRVRCSRCSNKTPTSTPKSPNWNRWEGKNQGFKKPWTHVAWIIETIGYLFWVTDFSNIIQHHPTSSNIIQHHPTPSNHPTTRLLTSKFHPWLTNAPQERLQGNGELLKLRDAFQKLQEVWMGPWKFHKKPEQIFRGW